MLRPTGSLPPTVYWRRRLLLIAAAVLLAALTVYVVFLSGGDKPKPSGQSSSGAAGHGVATRSTKPSHPPTPTIAPVSCVPSVLRIQAVTQAPRYRVGQEPTLEIQVTNIGTAPCIADLSDAQIELLVYNGESRVWGSHDCKVKPGSKVVTLMAAKQVRRSIVWTGLSSQPKCAGKRQRVGVGNYTLRVRLGRMDGSSKAFTLTP
jgi:hypothetical protein